MEPLTITRTIEINAPRERVWEAVTTAELLASWFPDAITLDLRIGGRGVMTFEGYGSYPFEVQELDPQDHVAYRWASGAGEADLTKGSTLARFTLTDIPGGTLVTVDESGFELLPDPEKSARGNEEGWEHELGELKELLERDSS